MNKLSKLPLLLYTARRSPSEFRDRIETALEVQWDRIKKAPVSYQPVTPLEAIDSLEAIFGKRVGRSFQETSLMAIEKQVSDAASTLKMKAPFSPKHNGDIELARFCYAMSRALAPCVILETGVAYGVTSAYLLQAIEVNRIGDLWSVDLPPLGRHAEDYVGFLVPKNLRTHWNLRRGTTRRLLPQLLPLIGQIDLFVQDSLHTYRTITNEIEMVWPFVKPGGLVIVDDVGKNSAFADLSGRVNHSGCLVLKEVHKDSMFGVLVKGKAPSLHHDPPERSHQMLAL